jgi:hypothetical protein
MINPINVWINVRQHCSQVHKNTNVPLILNVWDFMFFSWEKTHNQPFLRVFWGVLDFFDVKIAPRFAQDNLDVKKVSSPSKNHSKWLIMCFSRLKNIKSLTFKISGTFIVHWFLNPNSNYLLQDKNLKKIWKST